MSRDNRFGSIVQMVFVSFQIELVHIISNSFKVARCESFWFEQPFDFLSIKIVRIKSGGLIVEVKLVDNGYNCRIENQMDQFLIILFVSFSSLYRGPTGPYCIDINVNGKLTSFITFYSLQILEIQVGRQKWTVTQTPVLKISRPLSSPELRLDGKWSVVNKAINSEFEIEYDCAGELEKGFLICGSERYVATKDESGHLFINEDLITFKSHDVVYLCNNTLS